MFRTFMLVIIIFIGISLLVATLVKEDYWSIASVEIDQPIDQVYEYVSQLKNQQNFSVWAQMDPRMKKSFSGPDGEVGSISTWESDNPKVGSGEQEIVKIEDGKRIDYELRFFTPFAATEPAYITTEALGPDKTKVTWAFHGHLDYPMNLLFLFVDIETMISNDLSQGLHQLKSLLEHSDKPQSMPESKPTPEPQSQSQSESPPSLSHSTSALT